MGISKFELFTEYQIKLATLAKALGHPARIAIIQQLMRTENCICGDLVTEIGLAQPTISQHLRELKNLGIIKGSIDGTRVCYCIDPDIWQDLKGSLLNFFQTLHFDEKNCC
ncbi:MAG: metalloregulator ArsR/SmtB family transcription factor [Leeuwenhoekiella sp.]